MTHPITIGILLYGTGEQPRDAAAEEKYRLLMRCITERGWVAKTLSYHDRWREAVAVEARACAAVLGWINPTEPGLDRARLDEFLRALAADGVLVSAHPESILRLGTKDVLVATQALSWSVDCTAHRSAAEFGARFPGAVRRDGVRVLKRYRGHSGQGVWKVTALPAGDFELLPASRDQSSQLLNEAELFAFFEAEVFSQGSHLVDQRWVPTMDRGMVRAYLCGTKVAGFGYQEIVALHPVEPDADFTRQQPSRRHYYSERCFLFRELRARLEGEWIPALRELAGLPADDFPLLWDADFFLGDPATGAYLLCEINASCVSPFPESAITPMLAELELRLGRRRR